jgi:WD40 repeat protein
MYPVGRTLTFRDISEETKGTQNLTCCRIDERLESITSICVNHQYLAIGCKFLNDKSAYIFFYDISKGLKRIPKVIHEGEANDEEEKYFISISFSSDTTRLSGLTNVKTGIAKMYELKKDTRAISACSWMEELKKLRKEEEPATIKKITVDPNDKDQVCMSGKNHLRMWRSNGGVLKPNPPIIKLDQHNNFIDHAWIDNTWIATITDKCEIFFVYEGKECFIQAHAFGNLRELATCVLPYQKGLIVASKSGMLSFWEKRETQSSKKDFSEMMAHEKNVKIDNRGKIVSMSVKSAGQNTFLAVGYKTNFISLINLTALLKAEGQRFDRLFLDNGYHLGRTSDEYDPTRASYITMDMDMALHRPLIVTSCKTDSTIRIWNYLNHKCELGRSLTLERTNDVSTPTRPLSVSFHPSGYILAGGFDSQAIIWHVLTDEFRTFHVFNGYKYCTKVRFSHSGHLLAIAQMMPNNKGVYIHNTYTLEKLDFVKIPATAMICEIVFSANDLTVALCCTDGYIVVYDIRNKVETMLHNSKRCVYFGCLVNGPEDIITIGSDLAQNGVVRHIVKGEIVKSVQVHASRLTSGFFLTNKNLAVGTEDGIVKLLDNPLSEKPYFELNMHRGPIGRLLVSPDTRYAFTCGEDGALFVYNVALSDPMLEADRKAEEFLPASLSEPLADIVLVERDRLREQKKTLDALINKVQDLNKARKAVEEKLFEEHQRDLEELEQEHASALNELELQMNSLKDKLLRQDMSFEQDQANMEKRHMMAVKEVEAAYKEKLDSERKGYMNTEQAAKEDIQFLQGTIEQREKEQERTTKEDNERNTQELNNLAQKLEEIKNAQIEANRRFEEKMKMQDENHDREMDLREITIGNEVVDLKTFIKERDDRLRKEETSIRELTDEKTELQGKVKAQLNFEKQLKDQIAKLQEDLKKLNKDRFSAIDEGKMLKTSLLKTKAKYKNGLKECQVLISTAKGLKEKLNPITEENDKLKSRIVEIESEYAEYMTMMEKQKAVHDKQVSIINEQKKAIEQKEKEVEEWDEQMDYVRKIILNCNKKKKTDRRAYDEMFNELHLNYIVLPDDKPKRPIEEVNEYDRQIKYIHEKNKSTKYITGLKIEQLKINCKHLREENSNLLRELNQAYQKLDNSNKYKLTLEKKFKSVSARREVMLSEPEKSTISPRQLQSVEVETQSVKKPMKFGKGLKLDLSSLKASQDEKAAELSRKLENANNKILELKMELAVLKNESKQLKGAKRYGNKDRSEPDISSITASRNEFTKDTENVASCSFLPQLPNVKGIKNAPKI